MGADHECVHSFIWPKKRVQRPCLDEYARLNAEEFTNSIYINLGVVKIMSTIKVHHIAVFISISLASM